MIYDLLPSEEQAEIVEAVERILAERFPAARLHAGSGGEAEAWGEMARFGWFGLGLPEDAGGLGLGAAEEVMVMRGFGRSLLSPSCVATVLAAHAAHEAGDDETAAAFASGARRAAFGVVTRAGRARAYVADTASCDTVLLYDGGEVTLQPLDPALQPVRPVDDTLGILALDLPEGPARRNAPGAGSVALRADLLVAAYLSGIAAAVRDMATEYAKLRQQFGQPIGAFQAVKHRCADMAVRAEAAWAQTCFAAVSLDGALPDAPFHVAAAKLQAQDAAVRNSEWNIHVHGGMGFTAECDAQLYLKRTMLMQRLTTGTRALQRTVLGGPAQAA